MNSAITFSAMCMRKWHVWSNLIRKIMIHDAVMLANGLICSLLVNVEIYNGNRDP